VPAGVGDDPPDHSRGRSWTCAVAGFADLASVPDHAGIRDPCLRFPARRHRPAPARVRAVRDGGQDPEGAHPGRYRASDRGLDRPAGAQSPDEPRRAAERVQISAPRPRQQVGDEQKRSREREQLAEGYQIQVLLAEEPVTLPTDTESGPCDA
jgi:hypothetical protein